MTIDISLDRDELQIIRVWLNVGIQTLSPPNNNEVTLAQQVINVRDRMEAAIKRLPDKEL